MALIEPIIKRDYGDVSVKDAFHDQSSCGKRNKKSYHLRTDTLLNSIEPVHSSSFGKI
jgi:hypothetical protein